MPSRIFLRCAVGVTALALSSCSARCSSVNEYSGIRSARSAATSSSLGGSPGANSSSYKLPPNRSTEWNYAGMLSRGGIPSASWPICNKTPLAPLAGGQDDSVGINKLIQACPAGSVVQLGAGTFTMGKGNYIAVNKGVVLRGQGAGVTILTNPLNVPATSANKVPCCAPDDTPIIVMGPGRWVGADGGERCQGPTVYQTQYMQLLSADAAKDSASVAVTNGSIFSAGMIVLLDETSAASWQPDPAKLSTSVWARPDYSVVWMFHSPYIRGVDDGPFPILTPSASNNYAGIGSGKDATCWFSRQDRPQSEIKEIASVSGNTVTFTSPLHKEYLASRYAELTTFTGGNAPVRNAGIENVTAKQGSGTIAITNSAYSWVKNVEVSESWGSGIALSNSFRVEVRDSYVHDMAWPFPGGAGYLFDITAASSEILAENNIFIKGNKVMVSRSGGAGSVIAYNYADDAYIGYQDNWQETGVNGSHMLGSHHMLFEGNRTFNMDSDATHGGSSYNTYFRNWATTQRSNFDNGYTGAPISDSTQRNHPYRAAGAMRYSNFMSFVGNVLGIQGVTTTANGYVDSGSAPTIWLIGWNDQPPHTPDPTVATTAIRDGNWDWFLSQQTWLNNSSAQLPNSLYLSCKPAFMGSNTWPWVDPTTGATYTLPAKARYDLGTPNKVPATGDACSP